MRILHCCLAAFYIDNYSYQENILPRIHKEQGHKVMILASTETFIDNSRIGYTSPREYYSEDGILVRRIPYRRLLPHFIMKKLRLYRGVEKALKEFRPDLIFLHGISFLDSRKIVKYVKENNHVRIFADNHADFSNSARNWFSRYILHGMIYRSCGKVLLPYTSKFFGVLPARVDFLRDVFKIPQEKIGLLVMGAEDDKVSRAKSGSMRNKIREKLGIGADDFLIVSGGKIDSSKRQTLNLMRAVHRTPHKGVKLIIFGSVKQELRSEFESLCDQDRVKFIGWINSDDVYNYFSTADLGCFPGRHSVLWEQAVGTGLPLIVKFWSGTTHIDLGGNVIFLYDDTVEEILEKLNSVLLDQELYKKMKEVSEKRGMQVFSYSRIARISIGEEV